MIRTLTFAATALSATVALAHPGHGAPDPHVHPEAVLAVTVVAGIAVVLYRIWRSR